MPTTTELAQYLDERLKIRHYAGDGSNNGLQFDTFGEVKKAVFGVDACQALFQAAAELKADFVFVHHGISWGGSLKRINAMDAGRIGILSANRISLYAAHLPLDAHPEIGHNACISEMLELKDRKPFAVYDGYPIGFYGRLPKTLTLEDLAEVCDESLPSEGDFRFFGNPEKKIRTVGVVSGGGASPSFFPEMQQLGIDCLITGEFTHEAYHYALESGIASIALGHYRTEIPGVLAVMTELQEHFGLDCSFIELPTGL